MNATDELRARPFLRRCAAVYGALVAHVLRLEKRGEDEETLKWVQIAAAAGWLAHPGRYADHRLEAVALRAGRRLRPGGNCPLLISARSADHRRRVLHVATTVYEVGGHTRLIENWIETDSRSAHSLILLDQGERAVRAGLSERLVASGGELIAIPAACSILEKAWQLRQVAQSGYDFVILHQHPDDVVPLVALATAECPPVALMNHADHIFWLGTSIAEAVIDFRDFGGQLSRERRGAKESLPFPLPIELAASAPSRDEARAKLGIADEEVMLLTMGSAYKYTPIFSHNYFRTLNQVLTNNPSARLYVIGVDAADFSQFGTPRHERIELLGPISDPSAYEAAADLYLESFPYGSYTALIETIAKGVCPVLMYAPASHTRIAGDVPLRGLVTNAVDEADYVARVTALIDDPDARRELGLAAAARVKAVHAREVGKTYLESIYGRLAATTHQPAALAKLDYLETEDDLSLALFNSVRMEAGIVQQIAQTAFPRLAFRDLLYLLTVALRIGDVRFSWRQLGGWLRLFRQKMSPSNLTSRA